MDAKKVENKTISHINFDIAFLTRCNRRVFKNNKAKEIFEKECYNLCNSIGVSINNLEVFDYYIVINISVSPEYSANEIIHKIKYNTSKVIRENIVELNSLPSLWTRKYLVSTDKKVFEELLIDFIKR